MISILVWKVPPDVGDLGKGGRDTEDCSQPRSSKEVSSKRYKAFASFDYGKAENLLLNLDFCGSVNSALSG
jgi:hypothetical protein